MKPKTIIKLKMDQLTHISKDDKQKLHNNPVNRYANNQSFYSVPSSQHVMKKETYILLTFTVNCKFIFI